MDKALLILKAVVVLALTLGAAGWVLWRLLKKSDDPAGLLFRWVVTLGILIGGYFGINWVIGPNGDPLEKIIGVFAGMFLGLVLAVIWVPVVVDKVGDLIGSLYTGGNTPPDPTPAYSIAETKRKQGKFREAIYEIQKQLECFPTDVVGQMMQAEIQAENLNDLPAAQLTIERFCAQPDHAPRNIAFALNSLADWHLKLAKDTEAARAALERVIALLPDTEQAQLAAQRIAHLASAETLQNQGERKPIPLRAAAENIGLMQDSSKLLKPEEDPEQTTARLVEQLEKHPLDCEAREKLAMIYSEHYQRLDLAAEQLEQLIHAPNQPGKEVARWLNLLADLQLKHGTDYDTIRQTLERIIERFPGLAAAELAQQRIAHLRLELKGKEKSQVVKLGSYEHDLGLKERPPG